MFILLPSVNIVYVVGGRVSHIVLDAAGGILSSQQQMQYALPLPLLLLLQPRICRQKSAVRPSLFHQKFINGQK